MGLIQLFGRAAADIGTLEPPWETDRRSIYALITSSEAISGADGYVDLIEEDTTGAEGDIGWAPGALEGIFGGAGEPNDAEIRRLSQSLSALARRPTYSAFRRFYDLARSADSAQASDALIDVVAGVTGDLKECIGAVARRIALEAPDLGAVKLAIGLLAVTGRQDDELNLIHLARYEELTVYSVVAIQNLFSAPEQSIWRIAKATRGWGRIQAVRHLSNVSDPEIRRWILLEGHRNEIMAEEVAYHCAMEGGLLEALKQDSIDGDLLTGAGALIAALIAGGSAEDIYDYSDGAQTVRAYLDHLERHPANDLLRFLDTRQLVTFNDDSSENWARLEPLGWDAKTRWEIRTRGAAYLARPEWRELARAGLKSEDDFRFRTAADVAEKLGMDPWPDRLERQRLKHSGEWFWLLETDSRERIAAVLRLADEQLDLGKVGSGPLISLGLGGEFADDSAVDYILQALRRFPGVGWRFIEVGLRGRSVRCRNMALRALASWDRATWPPSAEDALRVAMAREPDDDVCGRIKAVLEGRALD